MCPLFLFEGSFYWVLGLFLLSPWLVLIGDRKMLLYETFSLILFGRGCSVCAVKSNVNSWDYSAFFISFFSFCYLGVMWESGVRVFAAVSGVSTIQALCSAMDLISLLFFVPGLFISSSSVTCSTSGFFIKGRGYYNGLGVLLHLGLASSGSSLWSLIFGVGFVTCGLNAECSALICAARFLCGVQHLSANFSPVLKAHTNWISSMPYYQLWSVPGFNSHRMGLIILAHIAGLCWPSSDIY